MCADDGSNRSDVHVAIGQECVLRSAMCYVHRDAYEAVGGSYMNNSCMKQRT
jgi:hypothetical protein